MRILFVTAIMVLADQASKAIVRKTMSLYESIPVIPEFFHFTYVTNDGMAFGINFPFGIYIFSQQFAKMAKGVKVAKTGIKYGDNKGHTTTPLTLPTRPSHRKGSKSKKVESHF